MPLEKRTPEWAVSEGVNRDLTQMRTGDQRTTFEIHNCRNATIHSCYLPLSGSIEFQLVNHIS